MHFYLSPCAAAVIGTLEQNGFEAFAVGGCVRDMAADEKPHDWDIATNALPEQVQAVFPRTIGTGLRHGTVTVLTPHGAVEVTTYRSEGEYKDHRRPSEVTFESSLEADLSRRDFTINAMAYNPNTGLIDPFGGLRDLSLGRIACVGDPKRRFSEDALRMMRAVRFACKTGFSIAPNTYDAISENAALIGKISAERVRDELCKSLTSRHALNLRLLHETGLDSHILPELRRCFETEQNHPHHLYNVGEHTLHVVHGCPQELTVRLAALLHDIAKPVCKSTDERGIDHFYGHAAQGVRMAREILRRLRMDNATIDDVATLVRMHDAALDGTPAIARKLAASVGIRLFPMLLALKRADAMAQNPQFCEPKLANIAAAERHLAGGGAVALSVGDLAVNGADLMAQGVPQGPEVGRILRRLLKTVLENPAHNEREQLLRLAKGMRDKR